MKQAHYQFLSGTSLTPPNPPRATVDFETRSACDIMRSGAWKYSEDPSTELLCLAVRLPHWTTSRLWHPALEGFGVEERGRETLQELFAWIASGGLVEAHNAFFEQAIWANICIPRHGWPAVPQHLWRCSAAKASQHSIPRSLGGACAALDLPVQKDGEGRRIMLKLCKPRKPRKAERAEFASQGLEPHEYPLLWHEDPDDFFALCDYCMTDVDSEHCLSESLPDLDETELRVWQMDQDVNLRGIQADVGLAKAAMRLIEKVAMAMNRELEEITSGAVTKASQRATVKAWLSDQGVDLPDTTAATLDEWLGKEDFKRSKPGAHRVIYIVREVNRTSTAKYKSCLQMASEADGRLRDLMMYHGASTGRWSGKGLQPHNFPRGSEKDMETACRIVMTEELSTIRALCGEPIKLLSDVLRGLIVPSEGRELLVADYSAIEARAVMWLAREAAALKVFESGHCIYMDMATSIYGYLVSDKVKQFEERQMGKQAILGLGFGMGFLTFLLTCRKYNITFSKQQARRIVGPGYAELEDYMERYFFPERTADAGELSRARKTGRSRRYRIEKEGMQLRDVIHELVLMKHIVDVYRRKYGEVVQMWDDLNAAAIEAVERPGEMIDCPRGRCSFRVERRFLKCYLPSGRALYYCDPRVIKQTTPWGEKRPVLAFMGVDPYTRKWCLQTSYGGKLCENVTQATARDIMAEAMVATHESPDYDLILSVHDELVAEADIGVGSVEEFEELLCQTSPWADGFPVAAEGWKGPRYRK